MTKRRNLAPYLLLAPSAIFLLIFFALPMFQSFQLALQDANGNWTLATFQRMVGDPNFGLAIRVTITLLVFIIPIQLVLALAMALIVNARLRGSSLWLYIYALPLAISELAAGLVWVAIFQQRGWLNSILQELGLIKTGIIWQSAESYPTLIGIVLVTEAWRATSIIMIILVAGLQSIPDEYLEAAEVYGATLWQRVRRVMLPMLRPALQVALILRIVLAIQVFATVIALAGSALTTLSAQAWVASSAELDSNLAAAYAFVILALSIVSTIGVLWLLPVKGEQQV